MDFGSHLIVIPCICAVCVGWIVKRLVPTKAVNRFIPLISAAVGVGMNMWVNLAVSPDIVVAGLISGLAATGLHQAFKQFLKNEE